MHLKKLELSGFKSFARATALEFPRSVTAIVGPNGAGKSNIKDAIQWVLGEQSVKSLRGKKGEDLIWNGSSVVPRVGKAHAALTFDSRGASLPIDFDELEISRRIFRDGQNEYALNGSVVRLKDVAELAARMGLGQTLHNIIGQGEVDRLILASAQERRRMIEDALGLSVYQIKKAEAERKLGQTQENIGRVQGLLQEIAPHLAFLRKQVERVSVRKELEEGLARLQRQYFALGREEVRQAISRLDEAKIPIEERLAEVQAEIQRLTREIGQAEERVSGIAMPQEGEARFVRMEARRRELERELGRAEERLAQAERMAQKPTIETIDIGPLRTELRQIVAGIRALAAEEQRIEVVRHHLATYLDQIERILAPANPQAYAAKNDQSRIIQEAGRTVEEMRRGLQALAGEIESFAGRKQKERDLLMQAQRRVRELDAALRPARDQERDWLVRRERLEFEYQALEARQDELGRQMQEAGISDENLRGVLPEAGASSEDLRRKIERVRSRLEESGAVDPLAEKEYEETAGRHSFLERELADLIGASSSLKNVVRELEGRLADEFRRGFAKIGKEFQNFFRIIFGGGTGKLELSASSVLETEGDAARPVEGVEIGVDIPRKRIRGLAMLSGGERALCAIAFLFALSASHPPPFLILDETDAALDEANSRRYGEILRELSDRTQILAITHNRETMKAADILYGVTMGEDGISKLLSLRLETAAAYAAR